MGIQINGTTDTISAVDGSLDINQNATFGNNVTIGGTLTYSDVTNIDSVGLVTAKNGLRIHAGGIDLTSGISTFSDNIQIADKIIHKDDTDTAIRFPSVNTFSVETSNNERLRITSAGKVGINTTNPGSKLSIWADDSDTDTDVFQIRGKTGAFNIRVNDADASNPEWAIRTYSSEPIVFMQGTQEKARFDSGGRLLIGTATTKSAGSGQYSKLNVEGYVGGSECFMSLSRAEAASAMSANDEVANLTFNDSAGYEFARIQVLADAATGATDTPGRIVFKTTADGASSSSNRLTIDKDGDVFMGNLAYNEGNAFNVVSNTYDGIGVYRHSADASTPLLAFGKSRGTSGGSTTVVQNDDYLGRIAFKGADGDQMHVGAAIDCQVDTTPGNNDMPARVVFSTVPNGSSTLAERLRINSSGNVSIGGIAPVATDAAYNKALLHIHQTQSGTYGSEIHLTNNTTGSAAGDGMFLSMWTDSDVYFTNQEAGDINFTTNGHEAFKIQSNKNIKITDGNLIIDTAGHGIDFSAQTASSATGASTSAELLDHYEEGSWVPVLKYYSSGSWNNNVTFSDNPTTNNATYVRIGKVVQFQWYSTLFNVDVGAGSPAGIAGLPFTASSNYQAVVTSHVDCFETESQNGYVATGSDRIVFTRVNDVNLANWKTGNGYIMVAGSYETA